jgi:hypothetical protein
MPRELCHANVRRPVPASKRVWLILSIVMFLAAWLISPGKEGDMPAGMLWWTLISRDYTCSTGEIVGALAFLTLCFGAVAAATGWLLQFPVCLACGFIRNRTTKDQSDFA